MNSPEIIARFMSRSFLPVDSTRQASQRGPSSGVWQVVPLARSLGPHAAAWDRLNETMFGTHAMLGSDFVNGLLSHFGDGNEHLCVLSGEHGPEAMCILRRRVWWCWASFLPSQTQIGPTLVRDVQQLEGLIPVLPGFVLALDLLCVDPDYCHFPVSARHTMRWHQALTMSISLRGSFDNYLGGLSPGLRKHLRRYEGRIAEDFESVVHRRISTPRDIADAVDRYGALESRGWKAQEGTALSPDNAQGAFYREVMHRLGAIGRAEVHELWFDGRLAASRLLVTGPEHLVILKTTYDERLSKYAPGRVLLKRLLETAFNDKPRGAVEFYTNATRDQLSWATDSRAIRHVRLFRNASATLGLMALRMTRRAALARTRPPTADRTVQVYAHPRELPPAAAALLRSAEIMHGIEVGADWYGLIIDQVFQTPAEPRIFVVSTDHDVLAILPMVGGPPFTAEASSLGNFYSALCPPIIRPGVVADDLVPLVLAIRQHWPKAARFNFGPMDPEGVEFGLLRIALEQGGLLPFRYFRFGHWSLDSLGLAFKDYLAQRGGAVRNTVSRMTRKFAAKGGRLEIITAGERLETGVAAFEAIYASSWKKAEPFPGFVRELMRVAAERQWLRLGVAWLDSTPVAAQCWLVAHGRAEIFKLAHDEAHKDLSAGTLLTAELMRHVMDQDRVTEVDYLIGDDVYKKAWMSRRDERWGIIAYDPGKPMGWVGLGTQVGGLIGRRFRELRARLR